MVPVTKMHHARFTTHRSTSPPGPGRARCDVLGLARIFHEFDLLTASRVGEILGVPDIRRPGYALGVPDTPWVSRIRLVGGILGVRGQSHPDQARCDAGGLARIFHGLDPLTANRVGEILGPELSSAQKTSVLSSPSIRRMAAIKFWKLGERRFSISRCLPISRDPLTFW